jgi:hypothetical protein
LRDLIGEGEPVIHAALWVNVNGRVAQAGLFRFFEGLGTVSWRAMEPLTEVSDMNDLARPGKLAVFRAEVLARLRRTDLKSYDEHIAEVAQRFAERGVSNVILGYKVVEKRVSEERAQRNRQWAATEILGAEDPEEAAAKLLGLSVQELRRRLGGAQ